MSERTYQLRCFWCGKPVSTPIPVSTVVRGTIECPECSAGKAAPSPTTEGVEGFEMSANEYQALEQRRLDSAEGGDAPGAAYDHGTVVPVAPGASASGPAGAPEERLLDGHLIGDASQSSTTEPTELQERYRAMRDAPWFKEIHEDASLSDAAPTEPTPAALREWAEWFDGTECVVVPTEAGLNHPSDLIRRIADAMEGR